MGASQSLNVKKASTTRTVDSPEQHYLQSIHKDDSLEPFLLQTLDYLYVPLILKEKSKKQYALVCIRHELVVHMMLQDCLKQQLSHFVLWLYSKFLFDCFLYIRST